MKWFKHISKSRYDAKIMRLIRKHGLRGYGLYFAILEGISFDLEPDKPIPELEETAHDIAAFFGEDTVEVEAIVSDCVKEGLFTINPQNQRIMCLKLLAYLDNTLSQNPQIKEILSNFKSLEADTLKQIRLDEIRSDKIIQENKETKIKFKKPSIDEIKAYCTERKNSIDAERFYNYYESKGWMIGSGRMKNWKAAVHTWEKNNFNTDKMNSVKQKTLRGAAGQVIPHGTDHLYRDRLKEQEVLNDILKKQQAGIK